MFWQSLRNKKQKSTLRVLTYNALFGIGLIGALFFLSLPAATAQEEADIGQLNNEIEDHRREIDKLQKEIDAFKEQIELKRREVSSLNQQVALLENQLAKLELDIQTTELKIEQTTLEIDALNLKILDTEKRVALQKEKIGAYINLIDRNDQANLLEVLLVNDSFSELFDYYQHTQEIHGSLNDTLTQLKLAKQDLEIQKSNLEEKRTQEETLKKELVSQRDELGERSNAQEFLLFQTRLTQKQYQNYVYQLQLEQQQINSDIATLEKRVREELEAREAQERFNDFGPARLAWPVINNGITAYFHDPDYPFRYIFEHPAIDIRAGQGTTVRAAESGYVARVKFAGDKSYAYIMLIHNDGLSTVYGHISKPLVGVDEYVTKGQPIALSGGAPGSVGAGNLSTGPHLHLEVRLDGIPVNPLEYLP